MADGQTVQPGLDDLAGEAAVLRIYRQAFAVLAREAEKMILTPQLLDVDEAIFGAFAASGSDGLTEEQVRNACRRFPEATVARRFEVLKAYGAVSKVFERPNERYYRAAFAPYVMLLFLRRIGGRGGQSELHELLSAEHRNVSARTATAEDGRASAGRLTQVFRLIANELSIMSLGADVAQLRENAQLLWGNEALIARAEDVHAVVLRRWPALDRECQWLRAGLAAYRDAIDAAAARLIERAGTTRALGLLPARGVAGVRAHRGHGAAGRGARLVRIRRPGALVRPAGHDRGRRERRPARRRADAPAAPRRGRRRRPGRRRPGRSRRDRHGRRGAPRRVPFGCRGGPAACGPGLGQRPPGPRPDDRRAPRSRPAVHPDLG